MTTARLARSTKSRLFVYICAVLSFGMVVYMFHGSQLQLDDNKKALATCNQQRESLSAQLQVIFEYKLRLEKSLQKEKTDHKQTKDECQNNAQQEKDNKEKEIVEATKKYSALEQSYSLLQSKQKDLDDENNELRKKNMKLLDDIDVQKKQLSSKLTEEQQIRFNKERDLEEIKEKVKKLTEENETLKQKQLPESNRIAELEETKSRLESELALAKGNLDDPLAKEKQSEKKVSVADNQHGIEPPKFGYKVNGNSTTPVINPEAVENDASSPKTSPNKSTKSLVANQEAGKRPTQAAASPLEIPMKQQDHPIGMELNRQIPMPNNLEPQQSPENTVIKKPDFSDKDAAEKQEEFAGENQAGEETNVIANPMNPIQEPVVQQGMEEAKHKALAMQWDEEGPQNGAHEEGEEEAAPGHLPGWRVGEDGDRILPRHMNQEYPAGADYEKDDDDEEGEQMDYVGGDLAPKRMKLGQHNNGAGRGVILNHK